MVSVTQVANKAMQPKGGYINPKDMECKVMYAQEELEDYSKENLGASIVGVAVDYLTRYMISKNKERAFRIAKDGAKIMKLEDDFENLLEQIKGLDDESIKNACKLTAFNTVSRAGPSYYKPFEEINPNDATINNIRNMVNRNLCFFEKYGPVISDGFSFMGAYTDKIDCGDADFLTKDTLWDLKVSVNKPTSKHTLQLLIYFIMAKETDEPEYIFLEKIGIINPRRNEVYTYNVSNIPKEIIKKIRKEVIGYSK